MNNTKIVAFYLPQFHRIPENDEWWGEGFTEWTNTKKAKPLFKNHYQPKEPLDDNYYNLLDENTREWQACIAKKYGIYGFCYYHYWFNGKTLLEKPIEEILRLQKPDFPFCLCWANEPWTRAWDGSEKQVIMPQVYGGQEQWKKHFEYLLPFFKDKRYIKIENKPVFTIYRSSSIDVFDEMIEYWDNLCVKFGLDGIYVIEELNTFQKEPVGKLSKALIEFEPMYTIRLNVNLYQKIKAKINKFLMEKVKSSKFIETYDYDVIWKKIIKRKACSTDKKIYMGAFVDWDNSARKGHSSIIIKNGSPQKFEKYLAEQISKVSKIGSEYIFINAWNEWAEGTYLEPDKKNKFAYLEAVKNALIQENE